MAEPSEIWMISAELAPVASTGGLGEVMRALPEALAEAGARVRRILPGYRSIDRAGFEVDMPSLALPGFEGLPVEYATRRDGPGVRTTLVECAPLFDRDGIYGDEHGEFADNARRFALLARAAVSLASRSPTPPEVLHAHDWHAALVPLYVRHLWEGDARPRTVLTIHNSGYIGRFGKETLADLGLPGGLAASLFHPGGIEFWGDLCFLKAGMIDADRLSTVSPTHRDEVLHEEHGFGLDGVFRTRAADFVGILNGLDYATWNPATDPALPVRYDTRSLDAGKRAANAVLRERLGLVASGRPTLGVVSRLAHQKGIDVLLDSAAELFDAGVDLAILGTGEAPLEQRILALRSARPDRVGALIGYDDELARLVLAGSDFLLVPSRYEPCGLVQLQALAYGAIPIVHGVGGLADTVRDANALDGTGFVFAPLSVTTLVHAVSRALELRDDRAAWSAALRRGMAARFSWDRAAEAYLALYGA